MLDCIELKRAETNEQTIPDLYFKINHRSRSYLHRLLNLLQFSFFFKDRTFFYRFILRKRGFKKQKKKIKERCFLARSSSSSFLTLSISIRIFRVNEATRRENTLELRIRIYFLPSMRQSVRGSLPGRSVSGYD